MKYLEQRIEELELEVKLLKAKNKLEKTKKHDYLFSHSDQEFINQEFITKFGLENSFASPYDSSDMMENSLDTITVNLSSITDDIIQNPNYVDSIDLPPDLPEYMPPYPDIIGSWDDTHYSNHLERKIEKDFGKIISKFKILHHEWEMDGYGYIVKDIEYNKNVIVTNHGKPMVVNKSYLNDIISGYKERIQETQRALFLINE